MIRTLAQHWWVLLLRGLLAIAFGLLTYARPGLTILLLVTFWGAYALIDGIFEVIAGQAKVITPAAMPRMPRKIRVPYFALIPAISSKTPSTSA